ncbi:hypothetical protein [Brevundimonas subvibrioides]|uniref:DUF1579 domain-containing protein n=1 Tax=Brevundimonas subvibrioides (strain ATCC 15264 / DSM 4735 / LMG 14903 / NBRC 16000 / CB 81) TaxID=633149 RepID=D9QFC8_BRESC|nr:hypothetical protein [Brevundimonas subvibrioides]ADL02443.1 hypothetical protein Bresu_3137 [Brevundimonas subvibrioides ATCC 15264]
MTLRLIAAVLTLLILTPCAALAQSQPTATQLRLGLVGQWSGALGYRDYQSDRMFEIPVTTTITTPGDGATQVRQSLFDDGPDKPVWITTVSLDDLAAGTSTAASFRAGNAPELSTDTVRVTAFADATHWTLVYARTGEDDDRPADIRVTETRDGDSLLEIKEVRPVGSDDTAWRFRNQTRLTRTGD